VKNPAEQKPTIDSVPVVATGPLSEADAKATALKKDAPVVPGGLPPYSPIPNNPTPTITSVSNAGTVATTAVSVPSAVSTTKEGAAGEQIVKDATSTIPVSLQNINFSGFRL